MRIATFNVNSVKSRLPILDFWLTSPEAPDILCLQETKCQNHDFPVAFFESIGYHCVFKGMKSYNGVAFISREKAQDVHFGFEDGEDREEDFARLGRARFGDIRIINSYVPQGKSIELPDYQYKLRFFDRILTLLEKDYSEKEPLLWTGDLNVAPEDMDVTSPEKKQDHPCVHRDVKEALAQVKSWGLIDIFRKYRPLPGEFSFWDYRVAGALARNIGWRIDHLLATPTLAQRSTDAYVVRELRAMEKPSDHTAVVAVFD